VVEHEAPQAGEDDGSQQHERPEQWGWHGEFGKWARVAGVLSVILLLALSFTTRYSRTEIIWLWGIAALLAFLLARDWYRRRNAWRS
jgi:Protein of unknown function (DUF2631)